jgi:hypothetical protein
MPGCPCAFGQWGLLPGFEPRTAPQPGGEAQRGNIAYVINQHAKSLAFSQLGATTQQHYRDYAKAIKVFPLKNGSKLGDAVVDRLSRAARAANLYDRASLSFEWSSRSSRRRSRTMACHHAQLDHAIRSPGRQLARGPAVPLQRIRDVPPVWLAMDVHHAD